MKNKRIYIIGFLFVVFMLFSFNTCYATDDDFSIESPYGILIDANSGKVLYEKNSNEKAYPASTTKILTAIIAIENCELSDVATVSYDAIMAVPSGYSNAALQLGEELTIEQLLEVFLIHSANDAGFVLAEHIAGSSDSFASMMNSKAKEIGCTSSNFTNPSGIHDVNHYSTASDMALIAKYCMQNSTFRRIVASKSCSIPATNKYEARTFNTTNELLVVNNSSRADNYYYKYAIGIKTGYTSKAKNCLVAAANKDGLELITVVLGAVQNSSGHSLRYLDTKAMFEYGYDNYTILKLREKDSVAKQIEISNGTKETRLLDLKIENDISVVINQDDVDNVPLPEIKIDDNLQAPIAENSVVGTITYTVNDVEYTCNLLASHNVEQSKPFNIIFILLFAFVVLAIVYFIFFSNSGNNRKYKKRNRYKNVYRL